VRHLPTAALLTGVSLLAATGSAAIGADRPARIRDERAALAARANAVVLELYALDSRLESDRLRVASLDAEAAGLAREQARLAVRLRVAERTLTRAQRTLGAELRALFEHVQPDALAIVLGADSLDDAIEGVDDLRRAASTTTAVISQARAARVDVLRLRQELARRRRDLDRTRLALAAETDALARSRAARSAYLSSLRRQERLRARELVLLEARARAAQARARAATVRAATEASVASVAAQAPIAASRAPATPRGADTRTIVIVSTGYSLRGTTATGLRVGHGIAAVDPTVIPLGTRMSIPGYGEAVAADTGSAIRGVRVDLWFPTQRQAEAWGWQTLRVTLH
jgi:3D (Asp-Asp-Asp) domain-containing protein